VAAVEVVQEVLEEIGTLLLKEHLVILVELVYQLGQLGVQQLHLAKIFLELIGLQEEAVEDLLKVLEPLEEAAVEEQVVVLMELLEVLEQQILVAVAVDGDHSNIQHHTTADLVL
jgi:hypothetical protein